MQFATRTEGKRIHVIANGVDVGWFGETTYTNPDMRWVCHSGRDGAFVTEFKAGRGEAFAWVRDQARNVLDLVARETARRQAVAAMSEPTRGLWEEYQEADRRWRIAMAKQVVDPQEEADATARLDRARDAYLADVEASLHGLDLSDSDLIRAVKDLGDEFAAPVREAAE